MAMKPHPVTGLLINELEMRKGPFTDAERQTAHLLYAEGHHRATVAAMLGRFPLAIPGRDGKYERKSRKKASGGDLSREAAKHDPRQMNMDEILLNLFGPDLTD